MEQKAAEQRKGAFERSVTKLEARIDLYIVNTADKIKVTNEVLYNLPFDIPAEVLLEIKKRYQAAGWKVTQYDYNGCFPILVLEPLPAKP